MSGMGRSSTEGVGSESNSSLKMGLRGLRRAQDWRREEKNISSLMCEVVSRLVESGTAMGEEWRLRRTPTPAGGYVLGRNCVWQCAGEVAPMMWLAVPYLQYPMEDEICTL